ncbi:MGMT family protein [Mariniluteicoccus endophyticus]
MAGDPELTVERVLTCVELVPRGRVVAYGDVGGIVGTSARRVGRIMAEWGGGVPWWRVTNAAGEFPPALLERAYAHWAEEGILLKANRRGCQMSRYRADLVALADAYDATKVAGPESAAPTEPELVPELAVNDLAASLEFWCRLIGFAVRYERPEEHFAYVTLGWAHVMLDQIAAGCMWQTGELEPPLGRGINLEIQVDDLDAILGRLERAQWPLFRAPEEQWYRAGEVEVGVRQFLVMDPDGYLLRLQTEIGERPTP